MSGRKRAFYDTRFIAAIYYPKDDDEKARIRKELTRVLLRYMSTVSIFEVYKLTVASEETDAAETRVNLLKRDFDVVDVNWTIARDAALIWHRHRMPMADAIIAATAMGLRIECVTNDPHLNVLDEIKVRWV